MPTQALAQGSPLVILSAIVGPGTSATFAIPQTCRYKGRSITLVFSSSGGPTFSANIDFSSDGSTWKTNGAAITALGAVSLADISQPFGRVNVTALTVANLTVTVYLDN